MAIEIFSSTGGTATISGLFIPRSDLQTGGLASDAELADAVDANIKRDKALFAVCEVVTKFVNDLNVLDRLGITVTRPNTDSNTYQFGLGGQRYTKLNAADPFQVVPVPATGANTGRGDIALVDIFPNIAKVATSDSVSAAGILIEQAPLTAFGAPTYANESVAAGADNRPLLLALFQWLANDTTEIPSRSATEASAITARTLGSPTVTTVPTSYTTGTDPLSGLVEADRPYLVLATWANSTVSFNTAKTLGSDGSQTWDVNSITA
jgi:hypothetical protein